MLTDFVKNCDMMIMQSVWSSVLAAQLAAKHLKEGGVLTLTGAQPALEGTAGKLLYSNHRLALSQKPLFCFVFGRNKKRAFAIRLLLFNFVTIESLSITRCTDSK